MIVRRPFCSHCGANYVEWGEGPVIEVTGDLIRKAIAAYEAGVTIKESEEAFKKVLDL